MHKITKFLPFILLCVITSFAQDDDSIPGPFKLGFEGCFPISSEASDAFDGAGAILGGYEYSFTPSLRIGGYLGLGVLKYKNVTSKEYLYYLPLDFNIIYDFYAASGSNFSVLAGPVYHTTYDTDNGRNSSAGFQAGLRYTYASGNFPAISLELKDNLWLEPETYGWEDYGNFVQLSCLISLPVKGNRRASKSLQSEDITTDETIPTVAMENAEKDSDGDGISDSIDKSPGTPQGVAVDEYGRPLDSDQDSVPDYIDEGYNTPIGVNVNSRGNPVDTDKDGIPDYRDRQPNTPPNVKVDEFGRALDSDNDGIYDYIDKEPNSPSESIVDSKGVTVAGFKEGILRGVNFEPDNSNLTPESYKELFKIANALQLNSVIKVSLSVYSSGFDKKDAALNLTKARAKVLFDYFIKCGIAPERIAVQGYGAENPIIPETNSPENNRVELKIIN